MSTTSHHTSHLVFPSSPEEIITHTIQYTTPSEYHLTSYIFFLSGCLTSWLSWCWCWCWCRCDAVPPKNPERQQTARHWAQPLSTPSKAHISATLLQHIIGHISPASISICCTSFAEIVSPPPSTANSNRLGDCKGISAVGGWPGWQGVRHR